MNDVDIINGASVPDYDGLFVIGSCDRRITFYSQQVRALNLACALQASGRLDEKRRLAVIGAGAAGLSVSAALAILEPEAVVHVYESEDRALHLQQGCTRRYLHPHIYEWPAKGAADPRTCLPLLDWNAAASARVAQQVQREFDQIWLHRRQPSLKLLRKVTALERDGTALRLSHAGSGEPSMGTDVT